ncbi:hypothetical protein [Staphylococcus warneri]|uniref:hypothetical protein n=1 Tax=Staphylococcus warneri TaxID=1292 RepID=UPI0011A862C6|nr:hypothetical protein [Staphylococcus warneri]
MVEEGGKEDKSVLEYLERVACEICVEEEEVVVLEWEKGNRSILSDRDLRGSVFGLRLERGLEMVDGG